MTVPAGNLVRAIDNEAGEVMVGITTADGVALLRNSSSISDLLRLEPRGFDSALEDTRTQVPFDRIRLLPPIDGGTEVWAAGVTYLASREAREEESDDRAVYRRVYDAERPELFFKAAAWRVVTEGEPIAIRADSPNNVPEPELGLVLNRDGDLVGYTIVDDVSSRSIEGENPLYLPQAKVYDGCCAIGPSIVPVARVPDAGNLGIAMTITRNGDQVFFGEASTASMKRGFEELARFLFFQMSFPDGAILATGTSVVPAMDESLRVGDVVTIDIEGLGRLTTPVGPASEVGVWVSDRLADPSIRYRAVQV